jgi:hypothetical protein
VWTWEDDYTRDGAFMWCGAFGAFAHGDLSKKIRLDELASTTRLVSWAKATPRLLEPWAAQPGDLFTIGHGQGYIKPKTGTKEDPHGTHIGIVESVDKEHGIINTIEGNAGGSFPDGSTGQGVVKQTRTLPHSSLKTDDLRVKYIIRPLEADYTVPLEQAAAAAGLSLRPAWMTPGLAVGAGLVVVAGGVLLRRARG